MFNQPIYNQNGIIKDYSDNGLEKTKIESGINYQLFLKRLSKRQRRVLEMKMSGFLQKEIAIKLGVSRITIWREMKHIRHLAGIIN